MPTLPLAAGLAVVFALLFIISRKLGEGVGERPCIPLPAGCEASRSDGHGGAS